MSSFLTPMAVDLKDVTKAVGSKDAKLLQTISRDYGTEFASIDEMIRDHLDDAAADEPLMTEDLLRHLIMGEPLRHDLGFAYGYALQFLCLHYGEPLPNGEWCSVHHDWLEQLDRELLRLGVDPQVLTITGLLFNGPPVDLPDSADFPSIGHLRLRDIKAALKELTPERLARTDADAIRASLDELRSWLETCIDDKRDLVTYYV